MPLDANGIWQYNEGELASPFSALLNKLAASVSSVIAPLLPHTTAAVPLGGGVTSPACTAWREGRVAGLEVEFAFGTTAHNTVIAGGSSGAALLPTSYRPKRTVTVPLVPNSPTPAHAFVQITSGGLITVLIYGSFSAGTIARGGRSWDVP